MTTGRLMLVDWARTAALIAMACFHFGRDFEVLGLVPPGTTFGGLWDFSARAIAGSFLFLAGLSLWLAHGQGIRWRGFLIRLAWLVAAAAIVSFATWAATPAFWVRFGILHSIALSSVLALAFLRLPWWVTASVAAAVLWGAGRLSLTGFDGAFWLWTGLGTTPPPMMDYEPLLPWLAPLLLGLAAGRLGSTFGLWDRLRAWPRQPRTWHRWLAFPGRHSLAFYLIHQPVLIAVVTAGAWIAARL